MPWKSEAERIEWLARHVTITWWRAGEMIVWEGDWSVSAVVANTETDVVWC